MEIEAKVDKSLPSINDFNAAKQCESVYEFEYLDASENPTGLFISVIGSQAPAVKKAVSAIINKERAHKAMLEKRGKNVPIKPIEDIMYDNATAIAACIVGWRGVAEKYTPELAITLCENNALLAQQVKEASENLENFTKSK